KGKPGFSALAHEWHVQMRRGTNDGEIERREIRFAEIGIAAGKRKHGLGFGAALGMRLDNGEAGAPGCRIAAQVPAADAATADNKNPLHPVLNPPIKRNDECRLTLRKTMLLC